MHKSAVITAFATVEGVPNSGIEDASFLYTPAPKIVPGTGKITPETKVVISDANPVGTLYYSTNGVVSTSSKVYKGPLNFSAGTTLTAALFTSVHDTTGKVISVMGPTTTVTYTLAAPKDADINQGTTDPQAEQPSTDSQLSGTIPAQKFAPDLQLHTTAQSASAGCPRSRI